MKYITQNLAICFLLASLIVAPVRAGTVLDYLRLGVDIARLAVGVWAITQVTTILSDMQDFAVQQYINDQDDRELDQIIKKQTALLLYLESIKSQIEVANLLQEQEAMEEEEESWYVTEGSGSDDAKYDDEYDDDNE